MTLSTDQAVVMTCHGTVDDVADIPEFVRNIRRGRPAPPEVVEEVSSRFQQIGGSPLMRITHEQASALEERLGVPVRGAGRLWGPHPADVLEPLIRQGVRRVISLPLAPQSVHIYHRFVASQLAEHDVEVVECASYGESEELVGAFADAIVEAKNELSSTSSFATLLTAHSLPLRVIQAGDPYQKDFEAMAGAISRELVARGFDQSHIHVGYQSQGMGGGDWLGPDLETLFRARREEGDRALLVAPVGFVAEHVETLYDIDIEAKKLAEELGFQQLVRMPAMNTRSGFIDALEAVARPLLK